MKKIKVYDSEHERKQYVFKSGGRSHRLYRSKKGDWLDEYRGSLAVTILETLDKYFISVNGTAFGPMTISELNELRIALHCYDLTNPESFEQHYAEED